MPPFVKKLFEGKPGAAEQKKFMPVVEKINALEEEYTGKTDEELAAVTSELREELGNSTDVTALLPRAFAAVRVAAERTVGMRHFDVQLLGGLVLAHGSIAEMKTGEGKTLVATLPVYAHALAGKGVHVVTVNDYLARRDAAWMGQVYTALGMTLGVVTSEGAFVYDPDHPEEDPERDENGFYKVHDVFLRPAERKEAYACDITYGTNNEFGFDYLRDNTAYNPEQRVQRGHHFALVDEVDSVLIDEARTPLIISGPVAESEQLYEQFADIVRNFAPEEDYTVDEKHKAVQITDQGIEKAEKALGVENLYVEGGMKFAHHLETAVRAKALFTKDKEYVVRDNGVVIVDEFTGRMQPGRRWSEGLHQAVEAKERLAIQKENRTIASVTFQNYFRMYDTLAGMTGTAYSSREEFFTVYGVDVVPIPTHRDLARIDRDDLIFQTQHGKYTALTARIKELHEKGQPVLIGTVSIDDNEVISKYLTEAKVSHEVLNAKNHEREGEIIADAGTRGRVTVATNMAGRGVDIKLGGDDASKEQGKEIKELGGLVVLGTERHEARRIDDQLRGRSGRQGDPGETQFYVSLEDKLMRVFATDSIKGMMGRFGIPEDEPISNKFISNALETAQKRIEGANFDARKQVLAYDDVLNHQRQIFYKKRDQVLLGSAEEIEAFLRSQIAGNADAEQALTKKEEEFGKEKLYPGLRALLLQLLDRFWLEHLETMEYLRRSVSLRAFGQRDPLIEYRREGLSLFKEMEVLIAQRITELVPNIQERVPEAPKPVYDPSKVQTAGGSEHAQETTTAQVIADNTPGRNDVVTITNGSETKEMKYKKAEPLLASGWELVEKK